MLLSSESRELRDRVESRWAQFRAWADSANNAPVVARFKKQYDDYYARWKSIDDGVLTNSDELHGACLDLDVLENTAAEHGYIKSVYYGTCKTPEQVAVQPLIQAGQTAEDYCKTHPESNVCRATVPKDEPGGAGVNVCLRSARLAGLPDFVCSDWFPYALGSVGLVMLGGVVYAAYKAAEAAAPIAVPLALGTYAPHVLPTYERLQAERLRSKAGA